MAWFFAYTAKILQRCDDAKSKELLPITIHRRTRGKRLTGRKEPTCQRQAIAGFAGREGRKYARYIWSKRLPDFGKKVSSFEFQSLPKFIRGLLHHYRGIHGLDLI